MAGPVCCLGEFDFHYRPACESFNFHYFPACEAVSRAGISSLTHLSEGDQWVNIAFSCNGPVKNMAQKEKMIPAIKPQILKTAVQTRMMIRINFMA